MLGAALVLTACGGASSGGGTDADAAANQDVELDPNATLRYAFVQNVSSMDPHRMGNTWDLVALRLTYDSLIGLTSDLELEPQLATSWEFTEGGKALVLELRDDVTFHDGAPFDASAVKANLERAMTLETGLLKDQLTVVKDVQVVDADTVQINLNGPGGDLPNRLAAAPGLMISPQAFDNPDLDVQPVGSGMFRVVQYTPNEIIKYERNEDYWDPEAVKVAAFEMYIQTSSQTRLNMAQTGQIDTTYLDASLTDAAKAAGLNVAPSQSLSSIVLLFNNGKDPVDDVRVRQAISRAVDRQAIVDGLFFGIGEPTVQPLPKDHWAYNPDVTMDEFGYDKEAAKKLLADAGHADGLTLEFVVPALDDHRQPAEAIAPMLEEIGVEVKMTTVDPATIAESFFIRQEGHFMIGISAPFTDPLERFQLNLPDQFANLGKTSSPEFIEAYERARIGDTREERLPAVHDMVREAAELAIIPPLMINQPPTVWTDRVVWPEGYQPAYAPQFRGVGIRAS